MLRIELPFPDRRLSPNARVHYQVRARATREAKEQVIVAVLEQERQKLLDRATVTVTFVVPDRRRRDKGNLIASAKAYLDGLVGLVIVDDNWAAIEEVYPPVVFEKGIKKTIIQVQGVADD
ncbi:hypothetical protein LCGC14_0378540 [marine sediment metagenome]|uniref:Uncharacterized protein n=1 Tax=marine sediment metagenome TaxID=412755 RepID=A0A0F9VQ77_9ZZZZ